VHEFVDLAKQKGKGWVDYMWPKPGDIEPSRKTTYIRKTVIDGKMVVVGAGLYED
jgi:cytochrome c